MKYEPMWNNTEAAEFLNISRFSLRRKVILKEVPHIKIGRRTLFDPADLRAYIESRKVPARRQESGR
jgi:excisionase family DNA binding protein